jgi:thiosulfate/3-mercaptopyruvate sulfurtransferase
LAVRTTLVSTHDLARHLGEWRVFDCRHDLAQPDAGEAQYREAHIPGALFAHLERDLSAPRSGRNGRHPLPDAQSFAETLGRWGLKTSDQVVCYDAGPGAMAARLWWMLRWVGHDAVAVLDGGLAKWLEEKRPVSAELPSVAPSRYAMKLRPQMAVTVEVLAANLGHGLLLDARAPGRYRGEQEPIDPEAGRIPGAANRFSMENLTPQGTHKPPAELRREFERVLAGRKPEEVVNYCGSGVAACHNLLAMEAAGLKGGKLYAGSWSEWIADRFRPREKG